MDIKEFYGILKQITESIEGFGSQEETNSILNRDIKDKDLIETKIQNLIVLSISCDMIKKNILEVIGMLNTCIKNNAR